jgi:hypothetical protein
MDPIQQKLDVSRRDLLDLGLRNTLLNYRNLKSKGAEIIDELPVEVYRILVAEERPMAFLPMESVESVAAPDNAATLTQPELEEEDEEAGVAERHRDNKLQTPYTSAQLQNRLLRTYNAARTTIEEQGINTLYLALGMLRWYEAEESEKERAAPLVLVPVEISRTSVRTRFHIRWTGEDIRLANGQRCQFD